MDSEKLQQFKELTAAYATDMEEMSDRYQEQSDALQQEYMDKAKALLESLLKEMTQRTAQYLADLKAILEA